MEKFTSGNCSATIHCALSYCVLGENKRTTIDYGTASVDIDREKICLDSSHYLTRLKLTNTSGTMVKLLAAYPIITDDFKIGETSSQDWQVFNGARQINDVPATCILGVKDASYAECVNRLSDEGAVQRNYTEVDSVISGDMITVVKSGKTYVSFEVLTNDNFITDISISADYKGNVKAIRIGGEFNCLMEDGDVVYTDWVRISTGGNFIRLIDEYTETRRAMTPNAALPDSKPAVYRISKGIDHDSIVDKITFLKGLRAPFKYIELGNGWQNSIGDWEEKDGLAIRNIASLINDSGYKAGIWTAPFLAEKTSELCGYHKDWILRHADGSVCTYKAMGSEYFVLDVSSEECLDYIVMTFQRLAVNGFYMYNLDHLNAFMIQRDVVLLDPTLTLAKAYYRAVCAIKEAIGEEGYICVNNGFNAPLVGIADTVQVASDYELLSERHTGNIVPRLVNQSAMRGYMSGFWFNSSGAVIDSDFVKKYSSGELRTLMVCEYMNGGMPTVADISDSDDLKMLRCLVPSVGIRTNPRDAFDEGAFIRVVDLEINNDYHSLCFFNHSFADVELVFCVDNKTCGGYVEHSSVYNVSSYFSRVKHRGVEYGDIVRMGHIPANSCEIVKIAKSDKPQIILSDMHFSIGGEVEILAESDAITIKGNNPINCKGTYVVALEQGRTLSDGKTEFSFTVNGAGKFAYKKIL